MLLSDYATDAEIIACVDAWVRLLEAENYREACASVDAPPGGVWTPELIRSLIKGGWDDARKDNRVTLAGAPRRVRIEGRVAVLTQRKDVDRFEANDGGEVAEIWYDLNVDGTLSDLTATFRLVRVSQGLLLRLYDICVR